VKSYQSSYGWDGKIALFGKALVGALARGALTMCAMWVEFPSSFSRVGRKKQNKFMQFALTYQRAKSFLNLILSISYLSGRLSFYTCCQRLAVWPVRDCGRITYQVTRKFEAGHKPLQTTETLIGYTACVCLA
jgi:hypothetical protein